MNKEIAEKSISWWAWWSNPIIGMHDDHRFKYSLGLLENEEFDYFKILEVRSQLDLPEIPDELLVFNPDVRWFALLNMEEIEEKIKPFAYFLLDSSILHARPQDWEEAYGISSPDEIRTIISERADLPKELIEWQSGASRSLNLNLKSSLFYNDRAKLCFYVYLLSFFPKLAKRASLIFPEQITLSAKIIDKMPIELWEVFQNWARPVFAVIAELVDSKYINIDPEMDYSFIENDDELNELLVNSEGAA